MENIVYNLNNSDDKKWRALIVAQGYLALSSKRHDTTASFLASMEKKGLLESLRKIPLSNVIQLSHLENDEDLRIDYMDDKGKEKKVTAKFSAATDTVAMAATIGALRQLRSSARSTTKWKAVQGTVVGFLVGSAITGVLYGMALEHEQNEIVESHGRHRWVKELLAKAAEMLGTNGVLAVGALLIAVCAYLFWTRWQNPPTELVYR